MRTCPPRVFESAQRSFDVALRSALERIVTASGLGFGDWQWRLSATLQTKLLRHIGVVAFGSTFDDALSVFNTSMDIDFLSIPSEITALKLMKKMADIYFTRDHTFDWLRAVPILRLGQTMNGRTYRCVLCYRLDVPLFSVTKSCSACSRVFMGDIYGDHAVSCAGIVGIKHRHNVVRDTLVDICYRSGISSGKEVDIGLGGGSDKSLRPADVLLYLWDVGRDVCVDLTGSSLLTQTGMVDFVPGRAVTKAAQRKRVKYEAKCADTGYGFSLSHSLLLGNSRKMRCFCVGDSLNTSTSSLSFQNSILTHEDLACPFDPTPQLYHSINISVEFWAWICFIVLFRCCDLLPRDKHRKGDAQTITKQSLLTDLAVFQKAKATFKRMGIWLCGVCFKTHTFGAKCRHGHEADFVSPPDIGDGVVRFVIYDLAKPPAPTCSQLDHVDGLVHDIVDGFTLSLLDSLFLKGLRTVKSILPKCRLGFSRVLKGALDKVISKPDDISCWVSLLVLPLCLLKTFCPRSNLERKSANKRHRQEESITNAIRSWSVPGGSLQLVRETLAQSAPPMVDLVEEDLDLTERNLKQCKRKICDGHYTAAVRVLSSSGVALYNDATLQELKTKHPFMSTPSLPDSHIDHHPLIASQDVVLDRIKSFPRGTSCGRDGLRAQHLMDCLSGAAVAISDELVSSITQVVNLFLEGNCPTVLGGYIASAPLTPLVKPGGGIRPIVVVILEASGLKDHGDDVGLSMLLVDFQNAFNLVDRTVMLEEVRLRCPAISRWVEFCYSSPARLYYGEHSLWSCQGVQQGDPLGPLLFSLVLHPLICKIRDSFNLCLRAWFLVDLNADKTELFWPKEDPRSRLEGIFPHNISRPLHGVKLLGGPVSVDVDFGSALVMKRVSKTIRLLDAVVKINDPQCELLLIRACAGVSKLYFTMRTCPPRVFESAQLSFDMALRSALERIVTASGSGFGDWQWRLATLPFAFGGLGIYSAGDVLNYAFIASRLQSATLQTKLLRDVAAPSLMKKMADIYFTRVTKDAESSYSLSPRQMALWQSQKEDHTSDWLRVVPISGLGQTMNGKTYRSVLCYRLGVPLFSVSKPCSACSRVFIEDIYGDHAISCAGIIGIKHRHNMVCDTLVDICFRSGISAGLDVCVDLTGSSPLTQTGMSDFAPGRGVTDAAQRKRGYSPPAYLTWVDCTSFMNPTETTST
ncbi:hypothetical protein Tco_0524930 [Tanacetum coccineum]